MIGPGAVIAERYELIEPIGAGGMGTIWKARHTWLERPVAVKFIARDVITPTLTKRFLREARAAASVRHRNVVDVIDFGMEGDVPYLVMEWLEGEPLDARLKREPELAVTALAELVAGVLAGLQAVHDGSVVHRDIKPANVFLVREGESVYPKIVDFGVSRLGAQLGRDGQAGLTESGRLVGTPMYMAPEQLGESRRATEASDLYSVGVLLYEALTGRSPFAATSLASLIVLIVTAEPEALAKLRPDLGDALTAVVERAMARAPEARYASATAMREALLEAVADVGPYLTARRAIGALTTMGTAPPAVQAASTMGTAPPAVQAASTPTEPPLPVTRETAPTRPSRGKAGPWLVVGLGALLAAGVVALAATSEPTATSEPASAPASAPEEVPLTPIEPPHEADATSVGVAVPTRVETPEAAEDLNVELRGVPEGATVSVDGRVLASGEPVALPHDDEPHTIEVRAPGRRSWTRSHRASEDGVYEVELPRLRPRTRPPAAPPPTEPTDREPEVRPGDLLDDPGF